ncbi:hypothetical protein CERSUDRAFT_100424 [Gelatoporia subvermispora B]|uniref:Uncharacterized protein n=1 Tax=Ceriporiopsis subvermispora (strain B) TaxID=914234 RepID=M2P7U9_CERS8|nr:hypothetical protein CERSUDRAFT_100424 [Gelatoporia subvermispora B]
MGSSSSSGLSTMVRTSTILNPFRLLFSNRMARPSSQEMEVFLMDKDNNFEHLFRLLDLFEKQPEVVYPIYVNETISAMHKSQYMRRISEVIQGVTILTPLDAVSTQKPRNHELIRRGLEMLKNRYNECQQLLDESKKEGADEGAIMQHISDILPLPVVNRLSILLEREQVKAAAAASTTDPRPRPGTDFVFYTPPFEDRARRHYSADDINLGSSLPDPCSTSLEQSSRPCGHRHSPYPSAHECSSRSVIRRDSLSAGSAVSLPAHYFANNTSSTSWSQAGGTLAEANKQTTTIARRQPMPISEAAPAGGLEVSVLDHSSGQDREHDKTQGNVRVQLARVKQVEAADAQQQTTKRYISYAGILETVAHHERDMMAARSSMAMQLIANGKDKDGNALPPDQVVQYVNDLFGPPAPTDFTRLAEAAAPSMGPGALRQGHDNAARGYIDLSPSVNDPVRSVTSFEGVPTHNVDDTSSTPFGMLPHTFGLPSSSGVNSGLHSQTQGHASSSQSVSAQDYGASSSSSVNRGPHLENADLASLPFGPSLDLSLDDMYLNPTDYQYGTTHHTGNGSHSGGHVGGDGSEFA